MNSFWSSLLLFIFLWMPCRAFSQVPVPDVSPPAGGTCFGLPQKKDRFLSPAARHASGSGEKTFLFWVRARVQLQDGPADEGGEKIILTGEISLPPKTLLTLTFRQPPLPVLALSFPVTASHSFRTELLLNQKLPPNFYFLRLDVFPWKQPPSVQAFFKDHHVGVTTLFVPFEVNPQAWERKREGLLQEIAWVGVGLKALYGNLKQTLSTPITLETLPQIQNQIHSLALALHTLETRWDKRYALGATSSPPAPNVSEKPIPLEPDLEKILSDHFFQMDSWIQALSKTLAGAFSSATPDLDELKKRLVSSPSSQKTEKALDALWARFEKELTFEQKTKGKIYLRYLLEKTNAWIQYATAVLGESLAEREKKSDQETDWKDFPWKEKIHDLRQGFHSFYPFLEKTYPTISKNELYFLGYLQKIFEIYEGVLKGEYDPGDAADFIYRLDILLDADRQALER